MSDDEDEPLQEDARIVQLYNFADKRCDEDGKYTGDAKEFSDYVESLGTDSSIVNGSINENVSGVRIVQSLNREEENLAHFEQLNRQHREANMEAMRLQGAVIPTVEISATIATALVLIVIGARRPAKRFGLGSAAESILNNATIPVLVVPPKPHTP